MAVFEKLGSENVLPFETLVAVSIVEVVRDGEKPFISSFCTGTVGLGPESLNDKDAMTIIPDGPLPGGNNGPHSFSTEPFVHYLKDGEPVLLRYDIKPLPADAQFTTVLNKP